MKREAFVILASLIIFSSVTTGCANQARGDPSAGPSTPSDAGSPSIAMPVEYVNYTVSTENGTLWATVDGTFPMFIPQLQVGHLLPMVYPTPPGTTGFAAMLNGEAVACSNFSKMYPGMLHYTYLGMWHMMLFTIQPESTSFLLTVHYQHPIAQANGTDMFLYDLNISPYLSNSSASSTAHFSVLFKTACSEINVYSVPGDASTTRSDVRTPVNFTLATANGTQTVSFDIVSSYSKPVPSDELVTFEGSHATQVPEFSTLAAALSVVSATGILFAFNRKRLLSRSSYRNED